jgi:hypothetical protein
MNTLYFDKNDKEVNSLERADKVVIYNETTLYVFQEAASSSVKMRNTYQVPAGQEVVVDTPQGQKKYGGGQYVPPEQLAKAHVKQKEGRSSKGTSAPASAGPSWPEMAEEFKKIDPSQDTLLNKASYRLKDMLPLSVMLPKEISPKARFAIEFAATNIINSLPILDMLLQGVSIMGDVKSHKKGRFILLGSVKDNKVTIYQPQKEDTLLQSVSGVTGYLLGFLVYSSIENSLKSFEQNKSQIDTQIKELEGQLHSMYQEHAEMYEKPPTDKVLPEAQDLYSQIQYLTLQKEQGGVIGPMLDNYKKAVNKEIGNTFYSIETAKIISKAHLFSMGLGKTLDSGLEEMAGSYPDTVSSFRNILSAYESLNSEES